MAGVAVWLWWLSMVSIMCGWFPLVLVGILVNVCASAYMITTMADA